MFARVGTGQLRLSPRGSPGWCVPRPLFCLRPCRLRGATSSWPLARHHSSGYEAFVTRRPGVQGLADKALEVLHSLSTRRCLCVRRVHSHPWSVPDTPELALGPEAPRPHPLCWFLELSAPTGQLPPPPELALPLCPPLLSLADTAHQPLVACDCAPGDIFTLCKWGTWRSRTSSQPPLPSGACLCPPSWPGSVASPSGPLLASSGRLSVNGGGPAVPAATTTGVLRRFSAWENHGSAMTLPVCGEPRGWRRGHLCGALLGPGWWPAV